MRVKGRIVYWKDDQGFGFIAPEADTPQVFVHIRSFAERGRRLQVDDEVEYQLGADDQGRPRAERVTRVGQVVGSREWSKRSLVSVHLVAGFLAFIVGTAYFDRLPVIIAAVYWFVSVTTFIAYGFDKSAARRGNWRTPESTLHLLALGGGWPGALAAQTLLRHKTRKRSFQIVFWMTVLANVGVLAGLLIGWNVNA